MNEGLYSQSLNFLFCKMGRTIIPPEGPWRCEIFGPKLGLGEVLAEWVSFPRDLPGRWGKKAPPDLVPPPLLCIWPRALFSSAQVCLPPALTQPLLAGPLPLESCGQCWGGALNSR